jgi:hypothetical protein
MAGVLVGTLAAGAPPQTLAELRAARQALANRRRVVFNNDGCDALYYPEKWNATPEAFLKLRTSPLAGSQVTTVSYCTISSGFGLFTHNTKVGQILTWDIPNTRGRRNLVPDLLRQGTDPLRIVADFCHRNGLECFWSMRMNDTHDGAHRPDKPYPLFPKLKQDHPEYLIGSFEKKPLHGSWTSVNYALPEIRELAFQYIREVCENYDIDGVELDFFRHLSYLKSVAFGGEASDAERDAISQLIQRIRTMTEDIGLKRGRPILITVRVPDDADYARRVGLDIERWAQQGWVDIVMGSGYFQLKPWENLVAFGKANHIPVYAGLSEPRVSGEDKRFKRGSTESYRGRALRAWEAGVDGLYIFNVYNAKAPFLSEVGSPESLAPLPKLYFPTVRNAPPSRYLRGGNRFQTVPVLTPSDPWALYAGRAVRVPVWIGDDPKADPKAETVLHLRPSQAIAPRTLHVRVNNAALETGRAVDGWLDVACPTNALQPGKNEVELRLDKQPETTVRPAGKWDMEYVCDHKLAYPKQLPWRRLFPGGAYVEEIRDGALYLADDDTSAESLPHLAYPWRLLPEEKTVVEFSLKLVRSDAPLAVCLRVANGQSVEYVDIRPKNVSLHFADKTTKLDTTRDFHTFTVTLQGKDIRVAVDGQTKLDGTGCLTTSATDTKHWLPLTYGCESWNQSCLYIGSASGSGHGAALWRLVRFRTATQSVDLKDLVLSIRPKE